MDFIELLTLEHIRQFLSLCMPTNGLQQAHSHFSFETLHNLRICRESRERHPVYL